MDKRGVALLQKALIAIVIGGLVMITIIYEASEQGTQERYLVNFYTKDIALLIESMQAVPGDVQLNYPLEEGYTIWLGQGELSVRHPEVHQESYMQFSLLQNIRVAEQEAKGVLIFTKKDNAISLDSRLLESDTCAEPLVESNHSVRLSTITPPQDASLNQEELELIRSSIQRVLDREGIAREGEPSIEITLSAGTLNSGNLILKRQQGSEDQLENNYESLYCLLSEQLRTTPLLITEEIGPSQSNRLRIELELDPSTISKASLLRERAYFAEGIVRALQHFQVEP